MTMGRLSVWMVFNTWKVVETKKEWRMVGGLSLCSTMRNQRGEGKPERELGRGGQERADGYPRIHSIQ